MNLRTGPIFFDLKKIQAIEYRKKTVENKNLDCGTKKGLTVDILLSQWSLFKLRTLKKMIFDI